MSNTPSDIADHRETVLTTRVSISVYKYKNLGWDESTGTHPPFPMSKLLYATDVPFKPSRLTRLSVLSMVLEWCTASWLSSHTADDVGCGKTLNTVLKNPQLVPGAYVDEIFFRVPPCPCPPSAPKDLSPPGPGISVMSYTETRESPVQGGSCASPVKGSRQRSHGDDTAACISDESVRFCYRHFSGYGCGSLSYVNLLGR